MAGWLASFGPPRDGGGSRICWTGSSTYLSSSPVGRFGLGARSRNAAAHATQGPGHSERGARSRQWRAMTLERVLGVWSAFAPWFIFFLTLHHRHQGLGCAKSLFASPLLFLLKNLYTLLSLIPTFVLFSFVEIHGSHSWLSFGWPVCPSGINIAPSSDLWVCQGIAANQI